MSYLELFSALIALSGVFYTSLGKVVGWPLGIAGALLYVVIFFQNQLYAEGVLQAVYVLMGFWGWQSWRKTQTSNLTIKVFRQSGNVIYLSAALVIAGTMLVGFLLDMYSDTNVPFMDAALGVAGLVVTWQMAQKQLECWIWWIVIDICSSFLFYYKGLAATSLLYLVFAGFAGFGYITWKKQLV